ncbi:peptidyl-prolyl cis-trans isomerase CYP95 [Drosophila obscura]|uniref:peptidyl-prolyl cis-trans isomerase CYP95 n=1 Tax=Drosophila obscura TaxID=7282 RepID=UPI001BB209C8|nr:peptidyl-prolyl cis-trans isomerase CYP95 [Drosophila obscura]
MSFFRNIRSSLSSSSRAKSSSSNSRDTTPVRSASSRPASVISVGRASSSRRDSTTSSTLQRGDTFILPGSDEEAASNTTHSNSSTLEKKSKKSKVFGKFSTFTKRKKTPSAPAEEEVASYEHHPSDTATNTYYKWRSDGGDRLQDYDAQADPFNFLYEQHSSLRNLQSGSGGESAVHRQASIGSNSSGSFDSSTYRKSKTPTHLREQLEQLKTHSNDDLLEDQQREEDEREKYKTVTLNSFRKSFRERLLQQQKEAPHNPAWFVEVPPPPTPDPHKTSNSRWDTKENRPDFLVFENDNYRPQSRSPLRDRPSRSATRSPVKRNETFRVVQPSLRHMSPSPSPSPAPSIRIEIKNSISPHSPGRFVPVGVAKPMPTTEYYAQRLLASSNPNPSRLAGPAAARAASPSASQRWYRPQSSPTRMQATRMSVDPQQPPRMSVNQQQSSRMALGQQQPSRMSVEQQPQQHQQKGGRTLVHIGSEQSRCLSSANPMPARGRAPTRVQLYGNKPQGSRQQPSSTYFGGHYNAPASSSHAANGVPLKQRGSSNGLGVATVYGGGVPTVYLGRREQPMTRAAPVPTRRNRSPIKMPWR